MAVSLVKDQDLLAALDRSVTGYSLSVAVDGEPVVIMREFASRREAVSHAVDVTFDRVTGHRFGHLLGTGLSRMAARQVSYLSACGVVVTLWPVVDV